MGKRWSNVLWFAVVASCAWPLGCQGEERAPRLAVDAGGDASDGGVDGAARDASPDGAAEVGSEGGLGEVGPSDAFDETAVGDGGGEAGDATGADVTGSDAMGPDAMGPDAMGPDAMGSDATSDGAPFVCVPALTTAPAGTCGSIVQSWPDEGAVHHPVGSTLSYCTRPPSSGDHYEIWASFRTYDKPVPYGYLVHDLEHGAIVILYKCASGACPTVQAKLQAIVDARPVDPSCTAPVQRRIILAPDPTLDVDVGASAWGWTYRATCVDAASLNKFIDDHYGKGPEDVCADGVVPP